MAMIVIASCAKENVQPNENNDQSNDRQILEIGLASTKTQLGKEDNGFFPIVWSEGDEIAVIENMAWKGSKMSLYIALKRVRAQQMVSSST